MLENLKILLGIDISDSDRDNLLQLILSGVESRLKYLLGGVSDVPAALQYIEVDVAAARFNRIGSEGFRSHSVEGETVEFDDNDFAAYKDDIQAYLDAQSASTGGKVVFL